MELELIVLSIELHIPDLPVVGSRGVPPCLSFYVSSSFFDSVHVYFTYFFYLPLLRFHCLLLGLNPGMLRMWHWRQTFYTPARSLPHFTSLYPQNSIMLPVVYNRVRVIVIILHLSFFFKNPFFCLLICQTPSPTPSIFLSHKFLPTHFFLFFENYFLYTYAPHSCEEFA